MPPIGKLVLVATPIGNLDDVSKRALENLREADFWIVEDTRVSAKLQGAVGAKKPMRVLNEHTTAKGIADLVAEMHAGKSAALITDGGCPVVSDPGSMLVDACRSHAIEIDAVPGPSAVTTALMLSGFFGQRFVFLGFLPRKPGPMRSELAQFKESALTIVLFESPFRIEALMKAVGEALPGRKYAICRELTKIHQQVFRGVSPIIPSESEVPRKGEFTIVVEGKRRKADSERT